MATAARTSTAGDHAGLLDKERIIAPADYNRWLVPPAALAIHLCIGMAYGFSVFWLPLSHALGITKSVACPADMSAFAMVFTTDRKSTRLNSSHPSISYAVFCLKKKKNTDQHTTL